MPRGIDTSNDPRRRPPRPELTAEGSLEPREGKPPSIEAAMDRNAWKHLFEVGADDD